MLSSQFWQHGSFYAARLIAFTFIKSIQKELSAFYHVKLPFRTSANNVILVAVMKRRV